MTAPDLNEFDYELPDCLIAQSPPAVRGTSRLMVLDRKDGSITHSSFPSLIDFLREGDLLVLNNSRVIPARVFGRKAETGARIEFLFLEEQVEGLWKCLVRPAKRVEEGTLIAFDEAGAVARIDKNLGNGEFLLAFDSLPKGGVLKLLDTCGFMPLPPYIKRDYKHPDLETRQKDNERYQTVFSSTPGSSAAPTAGLHFTKEFFKRAKEKGVERTGVTLHVGLGTFLPLREENLTSGKLHREYYEVTKDAADKIMKAKREGRRVIAVGTTATRTLESVWKKHGAIVECADETDIFIYEPYEFKVIDALVTNFHIPKSSLMMLVSAFAGREKILSAYKQAVEEKYRFFSYGDAMFIC